MFIGNTVKVMISDIPLFILYSHTCKQTQRCFIVRGEMALIIQ